ncbi:MAG: F0F1 ATP synthase subunit alpha [Candidatus Ratteibacteria bacterium]|nr:F0F1 ATP synthase subunit alpha [Candidatus Ratteibacteria bacterium]
MKQNQLLNKSSPLAEIREVGKVNSIRKFIVEARGLPSCFNGQILHFEKGGMGLVMGFKEDSVQILVLNTTVPIRLDDEVHNKGQSLYLPVGKSFSGRVINSLCEPLDNLGPIEEDEIAPVFRDAPQLMDRIPVYETMETGTVMLDALIPIAKGQRELLLGDRLTGKTTVCIDAILNQKDKDVICIYCCIGKPHSSLLKILRLLQDKGVMPYTIVVNAVASASVGEQYLAPYTASMMGEYFMYRGRNVLIVFDDLTRHAWTYRQISLLLERPPGREAYPGDIFYIHSQLIERAASLKPESGGGSMTFLPIVEVLQGDITGYIPTNLISMTDGQVYFDTALFYKGFKPAIDFGLSVSRIGSKGQWPAMKELSGTLRLDYIKYQELLKMTRLKTISLSKEAELTLKRGEVITQLIVQEKNNPVSIEKQVLFLYALKLRVLDELASDEIKEFKENFPTLVQQQDPQIFIELRKTKTLSVSIKEKLNKLLKEYFKKTV